MPVRRVHLSSWRPEVLARRLRATANRFGAIGIHEPDEGSSGESWSGAPRNGAVRIMTADSLGRIRLDGAEGGEPARHGEVLRRDPCARAPAAREAHLVDEAG